jgi:hypothetical protein
MVTDRVDAGELGMEVALLHPLADDRARHALVSKLGLLAHSCDVCGLVP